MRNLHNIEKRSAVYLGAYPYRGWNNTGNLFRIRKVGNEWFATGAPNDNSELGSVYRAKTLTALSAVLNGKSGR